jgi:hypothetical protein
MPRCISQLPSLLLPFVKSIRTYVSPTPEQPIGVDLHSVAAGDDEDEYFSPVSLHHRMSSGQTDAHERPRVPLIVLAQQQQQQEGGDHDMSSDSSPLAVRKSLSTITERTEYTEAPYHWESRQLYAVNASRAPSTSTLTSYGQVLGKYC